MNSSPTLSGPIFFSKMTAFFMFAFKVQSPLEQQPSAPPPTHPPLCFNRALGIEATIANEKYRQGNKHEGDRGKRIKKCKKYF